MSIPELMAMLEIMAMIAMLKPTAIQVQIVGGGSVVSREPMVRMVSREPMVRLDLYPIAISVIFTAGISNIALYWFKGFIFPFLLARHLSPRRIRAL